MLAFHCLSFFLWGEERKNCNCLTFSETFSVSSCGKNRWMPWTHWLRSQFIQAVGRKDMSLLPGTPRPTIYKGLFQWDDSKSLYRKWLLHQTSIYKMVGLGVPGRQNLASPPGSQLKGANDSNGCFWEDEPTKVWLRLWTLKFGFVKNGIILLWCVHLAPGAGAALWPG